MEALIAAIRKPAPFYVGQVVTFRPPVSGGMVVAVITRLTGRHEVYVRVTDGTAVYPTGSFATVATGWVV